MGKKKLIVIGIGLVILIIAVGIAYQNYEYVKQARKQVDTLNATIQQKDMKIMELNKEIKAKQDELSGVRAELDNIKKVLDDVKTQINKATEQPTIQVPQTVN
ncbi:hypothetical protein D4R78_06310 [bacterium]|nr:MAG: hypothetical protein D4R78_06310 [bacterium]